MISASCVSRQLSFDLDEGSAAVVQFEDRIGQRAGHAASA